MAKKIWYEIELIDTTKTNTNSDIVSEVVAKVKSKGLASHVYNTFLEIYKDTDFLVHVK